MKNLVLHTVTLDHADAFIASPVHACMLVGPTGSGKPSLAKALTETVLELDNGSFSDYPYKLHIKPEPGKSIGIDIVRQLEHFLSLKVPRPGAYNRAVIIEDAQQLTNEAQNALLKTLEEPPVGTIIVLAVDHEHSLLPTIRSRCRAIYIKQPSAIQLETYFQAEKFDLPAIHKAHAISGGRPGLMRALLDEAEHPLLQATEQARLILSVSSYERLLMVDELSKQRTLALQTTQILQQMAHVSLQTAQGTAAEQWQGILSAAYKTAEDLSASVQPKLALTELMLNL